MVRVEVKEFKRIGLRAGFVLDGFPSVGLASTIAANYLVSSLKMDQVAALDCDYFPPVSMIYASKPKFPARVYVDPSYRLAVFISEFSPAPFLNRPLAKTMLGWSLEKGASTMITSMFLPLGEAEGEQFDILGVGSTERARERLGACGVRQLDVGMIAGIAGTLLNEGRWAEFDVICLVARARPEIPDARAAARIIETLDKLIPDMQVDVKPLYEEAERIEERLKLLRKQASPVQPPTNLYV